MHSTQVDLLGLLLDARWSDFSCLPSICLHRWLCWFINPEKVKKDITQNLAWRCRISISYYVTEFMAFKVRVTIFKPFLLASCLSASQTSAIIKGPHLLVTSSPSFLTFCKWVCNQFLLIWNFAVIFSWLSLNPVSFWNGNSMCSSIRCLSVIYDQLNLTKIFAHNLL